MALPEAQIYKGFLSRLRKNGLARSNNFYCDINVSPPRITYLSSNNTEEIPSEQGSNIGTTVSSERLKGISFMCTNVTLPKQEISTIDYTLKGGVNQKIASHNTYEQTLPISFYCSPDLNERRFFETWMNWAIDPNTKNPNYYDEYAKNNTITIFVLPKTFSASMVADNWIDKIPSEGIFGRVGESPFTTSIERQNNSSAAIGSGNPFYYVKFYECYPTSIASKELSTSDSDLIKVDVEISYKYFKTITDVKFPKILGSVDGSLTLPQQKAANVSYDGRDNV